MIHAISMLLDEKAQLTRKLSPSERLVAAYALAEESAYELAVATDTNRLQCHRLLIRAHFVEYMDMMGEDARQLLRDLLVETSPNPPESPL